MEGEVFPRRQEVPHVQAGVRTEPLLENGRNSMELKQVRLHDLHLENRLSRHSTCWRAEAEAGALPLFGQEVEVRRVLVRWVRLSLDEAEAGEGPCQGSQEACPGLMRPCCEVGSQGLRGSQAMVVLETRCEPE